MNPRSSRKSPIPALVAAGLLDKSTPPDTVSTPHVSPDTTPPHDTPVSPPDEVADLRARLAEAEKRAAVAEATAQERGRALEDMRLALRAITATPHRAPEPERLAPEQNAPEPASPETPARDGRAEAAQRAQLVPAQRPEPAPPQRWGRFKAWWHGR